MCTLNDKFNTCSCIDLEEDKFKDECGVFGIFSKNDLDVASLTYYGLYAL